MIILVIFFNNLFNGFVPLYYFKDNSFFKKLFLSLNVNVLTTAKVFTARRRNIDVSVRRVSMIPVGVRLVKVRPVGVRPVGVRLVGVRRVKICSASVTFC